MLSFTLAMAAFMVFTRSAGMRQEGQLVNAPVPCTVHAAWLLSFAGPQVVPSLAFTYVYVNDIVN